MKTKKEYINTYSFTKFEMSKLCIDSKIFDLWMFAIVFHQDIK